VRFEINKWEARVVLGLLGTACIMLFACEPAPDVELPPANRAAEQPANLSWLSRWALDRFLDLSAGVGAQSGYVAVFARDGRVVHAKTAGYADIEAGSPMRIDTRFRIASMTKPVTAVAALQLIEAGRLSLDDPVERYIPAAAKARVAVGVNFSSDGSLPTLPLTRPISVRDLLTFTAGFGNARDSSDLGGVWAESDIYAGTGSLEDRVDRVFGLPLYNQPGEVWRYGWSADVLARVIEVAADEPFDRFLARKIFAPLGMASTFFLSSESERGEIATMYTQDEEGNLLRVESPTGDAIDWTPGGSGLVSTAGDYMRFALMLWNDGVFDGAQILSRHSVELMTHPHVPSGVLEEEDIEGLGWGLGVAVVVDADATPMSDRDGDFWWSGTYATTFFVSPKSGLVGVVLAQNQPGPFSSRPYPVHIAQSFAFFGL